MIDIHSHHYDYQGSIEFITCGYDLETSKKSQFVGIAPQNALKTSLEDIEKIANLAPDALGIGEIGMDYKWAKTPEEREKQEEIFLHQLDLASKYKKPVQIHCRECFEDILELLEGFQGKILFHFFSGDLEHYKKILDNGWFISIPPVPSSRRKRAILYSLEGVTTETDSPYVGKSPEDVKNSIEWISKITKKPFSEIEKITEENARRFLEL